MKVLMFSLDAALLDPASRVFRRMRAYAEVLSELHIIVNAPLPVGGEARLLYGNLIIYPTGNRHGAGYFLAAYRIGRRILKERAFSVHEDCITAQDAFPTGVVAWLLVRPTGIPFELQAHAPFFKSRFIWQRPFNFIQYVFARFLYPRADGVRAVSQEIARYMDNRLHIPRERILIAPVFSDFPVVVDDERRTAPFRKKYPQFSFIACMPARLVPEKNIAMAIRAFIALSRSNPAIGLVVMGAGSSEMALRRLARDAHDSVVFEPWGDPFPLYQSADVYLCTSWYEGWCLGLVEAIYAGVPIITTPVGSACELIRDGESGRIIPFDDSNALYDAILSFYRSSALRHSYAEAALRDARRLLPATSHDHALSVRNGFETAIACAEPASLPAQ